ncbi:MAG: hypothetical protein M1831_003983 [Alyxoria varia]|nr:MAG: hypothetical protein M1831_003983 [Alyxoria varia]
MVTPTNPPSAPTPAICSYNLKGAYPVARQMGNLGHKKRDIEAPPVGQGTEAWVDFFAKNRENVTNTRPTYSLDTQDDGERPYRGSTAFLYDTAKGIAPYGNSNASTFNIVSEQMYGCTALYIAHPSAVYFAHFWEDLAFSETGEAGKPGNADFQAQALNFLHLGAEHELGASLAARNDLFNVHNTSQTKAYIFTPAADDSDDIKDGIGWTDTDRTKKPLYEERITQLVDEVKRLTGAQAKVLAYDKPPPFPSIYDYMGSNGPAPDSFQRGQQSTKYRALLQVDTKQGDVEGKGEGNGLLRGWFWNQQLEDVWFKIGGGDAKTGDTSEEDTKEREEAAKKPEEGVKEGDEGAKSEKTSEEVTKGGDTSYEDSKESNETAKENS